jgi:very-short-patch-repair endonuclease
MKYNEIKNIVRNFRRNQTEAESILWNELRNRKLNGDKFLRQYAIIYAFRKSEYFFFVPDFYCAEYKLAIELDGKIHDFTKVKDYNRDLILKEKGIKVIRFKNEEVKDIEKLKNKIKKYLTHPQPPLCEQKGGGKSLLYS